MNYIISSVIITNIIVIPILAVLLWQMGIKNWLKWLLIIPAIILMDLDHFVLTNVTGFAATTAPGQKILHIFHTIEFLIIEVALVMLYYFWIDPPKGRTIKKWLFPLSSDYSKPIYYYTAWMIRIIIFGFLIHWLFDLAIYTFHHKWNYLYVSIIEFFIYPT